MANDNVSWLPSEDPLYHRFNKIKESVEKLHNDYEKGSQLKWFTPHGVPHYQSVESRLKQLLPNGCFQELLVSERFFLLSSAWVHDIGMIKGIFPNDSDLPDDQIREDHHIRSEKFIVERYNFVNIEQTEAEVFGLLARLHRRRTLISKCPEYIDLLGHDKIRVRLLAAYLRLADALHVDQSRVPANQYAITLAYNIPINSKLHWLRSMFVVGLSVDIKNREIVVQLKYPNDIEKWGIKETVIENTLSSIYEVIVQDLLDELATVKEVLFYGDISYFLTVRSERIAVAFDQQLIRDIKTILNYYFLMDNPSSSALCRLVLESIQGFIEAHSRGTKLNKDSSAIAISDFLNEIEENILFSRKCHVGLRKLVNEIGEFVKPEKIDNLYKWIIDHQQELKVKRNSVREKAEAFFGEECIKESSSKHYDILLYGYSELVVKSLCGFRDVIVKKLLNDYVSKQRGIPIFHKVDFELEAGKYFRIFVCEGQPKNKTAWGGRIIYHDGYSYALSLAQRKFPNICIIADAIAGTLMAPKNTNPSFPCIDFIMVGANGFNDIEFKHSAGHRTIAATKFAFAEKSPKLVLSTITDKYDDKDENHIYDCGTDSCTDHVNVTVVDGWPFHLPFVSEPIRKNIYVSQDPKVKDTLETQDSSISFYNPREDNVPIDWVDVVITENVWMEKSKEPQWGGRYIANKK